MDIAIVIAFLLFIGYREFLTQQHIRDLETKLVAKSPTDYAIYKKNESVFTRPKPPKPKVNNIVDMEMMDPGEALDILDGKQK